LPDNKPLAATRVPDNVEARQARHVELDGIELRTGNIDRRETRRRKKHHYSFV
jgi:hypothetical protein